MEETLQYTITADTAGLERGLDAAEAGSRRVNAALGVLAAGAVAAAVAFTGANAELTAGLANVETLIPGETARIAELRNEVQALAIDTGKSTTDITAGLYQVVSAFGDTADTAAILDTNARAAAAGLATTEEAIALTSAVTKGYGDTSAEAVQKAADLAFQTVKLGQTSFPELAASIGKVTPLAAEFGVTQEELFGIMATGTGVTGAAAEVSTQLRGVIASLIKPSDDLADAYAAQGIESGKALIESEGLVGALDFVAAEAAATGVEMTELGITQESLALALALTGSQAEVVREKTAAMSDAAGASVEAFDTQTQGVNASAFALEQWKQKAVVFAQDAGAAFEDTFGPGITAGILGLGEFGGQLASMGPSIAILLASTGAMPPIMTAVGVAAKFMWVGITGPVGIAVAAIAAVGGAIYVFRDEIRAFLEGAWNLLITGLEKLLPIAEPVAALFGVEMPESLEGWKFAAKETTGAVGELADETEFTGPIIRDITEAVVEQTVVQRASTVATVEATAAVEAAIDPLEAAADLVDELTRAERDAEKAAKAAAKATDEFVTSIGSIFTPAPIAIDVEFPSAGDMQGGLDMVMGLMQPPASIREALGPTIGENLREGVGETFSSQNVGLTISRAMEGGGGAEGAARALGAQLGADIGEAMELQGAKMGGKMGQALSFLGPFAGLAIQGAITLGTKLAGVIGRAFGNPSEAVVAARSTMGAYADTIEADSVNQERLADWMAGGFSEGHAKIVTHFQDVAIAAGHGAQAGVDAWLEYQAAVEAGDDALAASVLARVEGWGATSAAAQEAADEQLAIDAQLTEALDVIATDRAAKQLEFAVAALERERDAKMQALEDEKAAALAQMDEKFAATNAAMEEHRQKQLADVDADIAERQSKLDAGHAAELASLKAANAEKLAEIESARDAQLSGVEAEINRQMRYEKAGIDLEYALQQAAGDAEAEQAARVAHANAIAGLREQDAKAILYAEAEDRLRAAHQSEIDAINAHHDVLVADETTRYDAAVATETARYDDESAMLAAEHEQRHEAINKFFDDAAAYRLVKHEEKRALEEELFDEAIADWKHGFERQLNEMKLGHDGSLDAWMAYYDQLEVDAQASADRMSAIAASVTFPTPPTSTASTPQGGSQGSDYGGGRALGGPVLPGQFYTVGERGPEFFSPGQPGNITPGGGQPVINLSPTFKVEIGRRTLDRVTVEDTPRNVRRLVGH